ncbi:MAG: hypothetical protein ACRDMV_10085 [Streptosporangiales bacterium]
MELSRLRPVFGRKGPFATVYLEGRSPGEDAPQQVRLRWKALRERLAGAGAVAAALDAVEAAVFGKQAGEVQTNGRVLVATEAGVVLDEPWDAALGAGDDAHWTAAPELGALVREEARSVRVLVAVADQHGAAVRQEVVAWQHTTDEVDTSSVEGGSIEGVHKPRGGALAHNQIQRRADEAVEQNAQDIAAHLGSVEATFRPRVLVLAGETQARTAVRDELSARLAGICVEADRGGTDDDAAEQALAEQIRQIASEESARNAAARSEQLNEGLAHGRAVHGAEAVGQAAERGAVDTLLFEHHVSAVREAALLHACAETGASVDLVDTGTDLGDGVGALLRFPLPS